MICRYCRAQNGADEHRCSRCGRHLSDEPARFPVQMGSAAPAVESTAKPAAQSAPQKPGPKLAPAPPSPLPAQELTRPVQPSLFGPMAVAKQREAAAPRAAQRVTRKSAPPLQQQFDFVDGPRTLPTSVPAAVYCHAPVAQAPQRAAAAAIDMLIPLAGFAVFFAVATYTGGTIALDRRSIPVMSVATVLIILFYRLVCCLGNMDTPGVYWAGLRLLDFDGRIPTRRARLSRLAGGVVSVVSAGIGLLWSLADEERLTWHDHMSRTFPTPRNPDRP